MEERMRKKRRRIVTKNDGGFNGRGVANNGNEKSTRKITRIKTADKKKTNDKESTEKEEED